MVKVQNHLLLEHLKKRHNILFLSKNHTCHWLSCKLAGMSCVWRHQRGVPLHLSLPSLSLPLSIYLSVEWNSSSVVRTRHMISIQAGESGRCITGSEWTTSCWPDQGRKTHVLLVLAGWLPAERVGNSCSRRDEGMETWTTWRRRRKRACLHVSTLP